MIIQTGDAFEAVLRREADDGPSDHPQRIEGYRITILSVSGERVAYRRTGSAPSETTLSILQEAIHRGDLVKTTANVPIGGAIHALSRPSRPKKSPTE